MQSIRYMELRGANHLITNTAFGYLSYLRAAALALGLSDTCRKKKQQQKEKIRSHVHRLCLTIETVIMLRTRYDV